MWADAVGLSFLISQLCSCLYYMVFDAGAGSRVVILVFLFVVLAGGSVLRTNVRRFGSRCVFVVRAAGRSHCVVCCLFVFFLLALLCFGTAVVGVVSVVCGPV